MMAETKDQALSLSIVSGCPPTPAGVQLSASRLLQQQHAVRDATTRLARTPPHALEYQRLAHAYERRLADALQDRVVLRDEMRAFGGYLRRQDVRPEHVVPCVRQAIGAAARAMQLPVEELLQRDVVTWAIQGYYAAE